MSCDLNQFPVSLSAFLFCHICGHANSTWTYYRLSDRKCSEIHAPRTPAIRQKKERKNISTHYIPICKINKIIELYSKKKMPAHKNNILKILFLINYLVGDYWHQLFLIKNYNRIECTDTRRTGCGETRRTECGILRKTKSIKWSARMKNVTLYYQITAFTVLENK